MQNFMYEWIWHTRIIYALHHVYLSITQFYRMFTIWVHPFYVKIVVFRVYISYLGLFPSFLAACLNTIRSIFDLFFCSWRQIYYAIVFFWFQKNEQTSLDCRRASFISFFTSVWESSSFSYDYFSICFLNYNSAGCKVASLTVLLRNF